MDALLQASPEAAGWAAVAAVYAATYVAASLVPVAATPGYVIDPATGKPQLYRLNGLRCLVLLVAAAAAAVAAGGVPGGLLYELYWPCTRAACAYGLALSAAMYVRGTRLLATRGGIDRRARCPTADAPAGGPRRDTADFDARSAAAHFYCGLSEFNPAGPGGVDLKMWLYLAGAVQLQLNVLSAVYAAVAATSGGAGFSVASLRALPPPLLAYAGCLTFFVVEYLYHEDVHTYTYDIFRERVGFKLVWGCLCFYPQFYCVGVFFVTGAAAATPVSPAAAWGCVALFFGGWVLTRGASEWWLRTCWGRRRAFAAVAGRCTCTPPHCSPCVHIAPPRHPARRPAEVCVQDGRRRRLPRRPFWRAGAHGDAAR